MQSRTRIGAASWSAAAAVADQLSIQVWDTGRGIPADEQEHVFQEFYQLGNPERDRTKGVGLGLAIVRRLTQLLGHPLTLQLRARQRQHVWDQRAVCEHRGGRDCRQTGEFTLPFLAHGVGLILVIDDEVSIQIAMKSLLESWGYEAITAGSCDEMLERIATHRTAPRLIISDYRLRDNASGIDAIERLRSEYNDEIPGNADHRRHRRGSPQGSAGKRFPAAAQARAESSLASVDCSPDRIERQSSRLKATATRDPVVLLPMSPRKSRGYDARTGCRFPKFSG